MISLGTLGILLAGAGGVVGGVDKYNRHKKEVEQQKKLDDLISDLEKKNQDHSNKEKES